MTKLKSRKTIDIQSDEVPKEVMRFFLDLYDRCNDVYVEHQIDDDFEDEKANILDRWLLDNTDAKDQDEILIKYWW